MLKFPFSQNLETPFFLNYIELNYKRPHGNVFQYVCPSVHFGPYTLVYWEDIYYTGAGEFFQFTKDTFLYSQISNSACGWPILCWKICEYQRQPEADSIGLCCVDKCGP